MEQGFLDGVTKTDDVKHVEKTTLQRSTSRVRARKIIVQKRKGRRQGTGSRKGKKTSRLSKKRQWIN